MAMRKDSKSKTMSLREVVLMKDASAKRVFLRVKVGGLLQMVAPQVEVLVLIGGCPRRRRQNPFRRSLKT